MGRFCGPVVRMRGLPWSATPQDIRDFFSGLEVTQDGIVLARNADGRVTGEAYVLFHDEENFQRAMTRNREHIGKRYIELFKSSGEEMELALKRAIASPVSQPRPKLPPTRPRMNSSHSVDAQFRFPGDPTPLWEVTPTISLPVQFQGIGGGFTSSPTSPILPALWMPERMDESWFKPHLQKRTMEQGQASPLPSTIMDCVQLRGLPYSATHSQVLDFFTGLTLGEGGIHFIYDASGRPTGNGYVHFASVEEAIKATDKHKVHMGQRYIEVFRCPRIEMINAVGPFRFNIDQRHPWSPSVNLTNGGQLATPDMLSPSVFPTSPGSFSPVMITTQTCQPNHSHWPQDAPDNLVFTMDNQPSLLQTQPTWSNLTPFSPDPNSYPFNPHSVQPNLTPNNLQPDPSNYNSPKKNTIDPMTNALLSPRIQSNQNSPLQDLPLDLIRSFSQVSVQEQSPSTLTSEQIADNLFSALPNLFNNDQYLPHVNEEVWSDAIPSRCVVRMRGIPYNTDKYEILNFFTGFSLTENDILICYNDDLKPTGEAFVSFLTLEEAQRAIVEKDRKHIGPRYVELFLDKTG